MSDFIHDIPLGTFSILLNSTREFFSPCKVLEANKFTQQQKMHAMGFEPKTFLIRYMYQADTLHVPRTSNVCFLCIPCSTSNPVWQ